MKIEIITEIDTYKRNVLLQDVKLTLTKEEQAAISTEDVDEIMFKARALMTNLTMYHK